MAAGVLSRVARVSQAIRAACENAVGVGAQDPVGRDLGGPFWRVLRAETSCNLHWGQARVDHCHTDLDDASRFLERIGTAPA